MIKFVITILLLTSHLLKAEHVSVAPSDIFNYTMDIDSDGIPEIEFVSATPEGLTNYFVTVDALKTRSLFRGSTFVGIHAESFDSVHSLLVANPTTEKFKISETSRSENNVNGFGSIQAPEPVISIWGYGTSGSGSDPINLFVIIIDLSNYYSTEGVANMNLFTKSFGPTTEGTELAGLSPRSTGLAAFSELKSLNLVRNEITHLAEIELILSNQEDAQYMIEFSNNLESWAPHSLSPLAPTKTALIIKAPLHSFLTITEFYRVSKLP